MTGTRSRRLATNTLVGAAVGLVVMSVGAPLAVALGRSVAGVIAEGPGALGVAPLLLAQTVAWAAGVGVLATVLAWPAAWVIRRRGWGAACFLGVPLLLPTYLAYAAYGMARAPRTVLGDWVEGLAQGGWPSAPLIAGDVVAVLGLSLWSWPLAALVLGAHVSGLDPRLLDALELDGARGWGRVREVLAMCRRGIVASAGVVTLVMMGSAVPFHVAQVQTYSLVAWQALNLEPTGWRAWAGAWPLIGVACVAGWALTPRVVRPAPGMERVGGRMGRGGGAGSLAGAAVVWALSVVVPLVVFVATVREPGSYRAFWVVSGGSVLNSLWIAGVVGVACAGIGAAVWHGLGAGGAAARGAAWCVRLSLIGALMPGILVGAAVSITGSALGLRWIGDTSAGVVLGHIARFGCVGAIAGCWLHALEPASVREARRLDGADDLVGWIAASPGRVAAGAMAGVFAAGGALSLHEIEATVILQAPGAASLAQTFLGWLHFARYEELSAGGAILVGGGVLVALMGAMGFRMAARNRPDSSPRRDD